MKSSCPRNHYTLKTKKKTSQEGVNFLFFISTCQPKEKRASHFIHILPVWSKSETKKPCTIGAPGVTRTRSLLIRSRPAGIAEIIAGTAFRVFWLFHGAVKEM
jgi:hypothetical protein